MKSLRLILSVVLMSLSTVAFAQSDAQKPVAQSDAQKTVAQSDAQKMDAPKAAAPKSDAQMSFDTMKTLAGSWEG
ncbi:MAG TPA: hypothetical protein VF840_06435, partial [Terriglobales bacterium]